MERATIDVPAKMYEVPVEPAPGEAKGIERSTGTLTPPFDRIRSLLSDKPLKRPNRQRPLPR